MPLSSKEKVLSYKPRVFDQEVSENALNYLESKEKGSDFRVSDVLKQEAGIKQIEEMEEKEIVEKLTLERIEKIQTQAYEQAYQLGMNDGETQAFEKSSKEINEQLDSLKDLLLKIQNLKIEMVAENESYIIQFAFFLATKLVYREIDLDQNIVLDLMKESIALTQSEEAVTVKVNPDQLSFIELLQKKEKKDFDFLEQVKLEADASVSPGGCIVETNYGEIDSRIEQRIEKLWESLKEHLPKSKNILGVA